MKTEGKQKSICVVCRQEKDGSPIQDDPYILLVRSLKGRLGMATGNRLVVCEADLPKYGEKRKRFERYIMWFGFLAILLVLMFLFSSPSIFGIPYLLLGVLLVMVIPLLTYFPGIREEKAEPEKKVI